MLEDGKEVPTREIANAFLPMDTEVVSVNKLLTEISHKFGNTVGREFVNFILTKEIPQSKEIFIEFFKDKKDLMSQSCLAKLTGVK